ncbi:hypothetical protein U0070_001482 [Myodes glareolus]|uniref:Uncharacterized protein n=1 Tax=Myodes glareolus TaxID=447135 RepID=A0AAW0H4K6_MYOGA
MDWVRITTKPNGNHERAQREHSLSLTLQSSHMRSPKQQDVICQLEKRGGKQALGCSGAEAEQEPDHAFTSSFAPTTAASPLGYTHQDNTGTLSLLIHAEVESTVHATNADQANCYTDKFQNACETKSRQRRVRAQKNANVVRSGRPGNTVARYHLMQTRRIFIIPGTTLSTVNSTTSTKSTKPSVARAGAKQVPPTVFVEDRKFLTLSPLFCASPLKPAAGNERVGRQKLLHLHLCPLQTKQQKQKKPVFVSFVERRNKMIKSLRHTVRLQDIETPISN